MHRLKTLAPFLIVVLGFVGFSLAVGPREPLTFKNVGLYCGPNDYFASPDCPFDFFVVPGNGPFEGRDNTAWNEWLKKARKAGKRVICDLNPQVKLPNGEYTNISLLGDKADDAALDAMVRVIGEFFAQVDYNELYGVTLCEEQIFWNGQAENLNKLYDKLKAKYNVPVFQWVSGSSTGSPPGIVWPNLKSDGWVADEYHLNQPYMEKTMRAYIIQQKPFVHITWAGGDKASVPFLLDRFWQQVEVCRKYDIPNSYFTHYGVGGSWGWSEDAPRNLKRIFDLPLQVAATAKTQTQPVQTQGWDFVPWEIPVIKLRFENQDAKTATYREKTAVDRSVRFINDAEIRGFADLRWDSSPVELRPRQPGKATASISYTFECPLKIAQLRVSSDGFASADKQAVLSMSIVDPKGKVVKTGTLTSKDVLRLTVPGSELGGQRFKVVFGMTGTAGAAGEVLAGIGSLDVDADVVLPEEKLIPFQLDSMSGVSYEEDLTSMSVYHTADIKNGKYIIPTVAGLYANAPSQTVEVIQKFRAPTKVALTKLCVKGRADEPGNKARLGIGVSLNGVDVLAKKMSEGAFDGELQVDLSDLKDRIQSSECYVHLFLEGSYGLITSYSIDGRVVK